MSFWNRHLFSGWGGWGAVGDPNIRPAPYYAAIGDPRLQPALWLVVTTYNAVTGVPLIEHKFYGRTEEEAQQRYQIHMQADKFIAACGPYDDQPHEYNGTPCQSTWRWERA